MKLIAEFFKQIILSPVGIGVSVVHWIVVFYAVYGETRSGPFHFTYEPLLAQWLYLLNSPALFLAGLILLPFISVFGENILTLYFGLFLFLHLLLFNG